MRIGVENVRGRLVVVSMRPAFYIIARKSPRFEESGMPAADLKNMDVDALLALRADVEKMLVERARDLERQLALLGNESGKRRGRPPGGAGRASMLLRLEDPHRSALENYVYRPPRLGNHRSVIVRISMRRSIPTSIAPESLHGSDRQNHMPFLSKSSPKAVSTKVAPARTARSPSLGRAIVSS